MTKKHYVMIAASIAAERKDRTDGSICQGSQLSTLKALALTLAHQFEQDNPRFDTETFLDACGVV